MIRLLHVSRHDTDAHAHLRSAHFLDPGVRAILETALTPDDNDLFLSNLVNTPVLAIHGFVRICLLP